LVQRVLVRGQPGVIGGPKKVLKTTTLMDLAVSLASATDFLGRFQVYHKHRVVMISGESGEAVLQETGRRVCAARGINPEPLDVHWSFRLPQLSNVLDRRELARGLKELQAGVVILDPLYLSLLSGADARDVEAGNLYHMGPLLRDLARSCLDVGCTPLLCHHARKSTAASFDPMDLDDLSFAGIAEFARQWILENRRAPFDGNTGSHKLWLSVGGSAGQSGCWAMDVEEGVLRDDFSGRKWEVNVYTMAEAKEGAVEGKEREKEERQARQVKSDGTKVLNALDSLADDTGAAGYTAVRTHSNLSNDRMARAVMALVQEGCVVEVPVRVQTGLNLKTTQTVKGIARRTSYRPAGPAGPAG
jgi:replicative DNA helicase